MASGQGQPWSGHEDAHDRGRVPAVKPADRSISPSSRTKTRPIAMTMTAALWLIRLAKLNGVGEGRRAQRGEDDDQDDQAERRPAASRRRRRGPRAT